MTTRIKKTLLRLLAIAGFVLTSPIANADIGGVIEGDFSIYDVSGVYSYGGTFGISYQSEYGTHYLLGSAFYLEQDDRRGQFGGLLGGGGFDVNSVGFGLAYRYGFSFFENFEPYIEYGWNNISASYNTIDVLGNPVTFEPDSSGDYLAVGILYRFWEDLHLKAEIGYYGLLSDQTIDTPATDAFGNPMVLRETIHLSGTIGISFKF